MKKFFVITLLVALPFIFSPLGMISGEIINPLEGKIIALDAGHGGEDNGAVNQRYGVVEKDVNLAVTYVLKDKLNEGGAEGVVLTRVCNETINSRKERVDLAIEKCKDQYGRKCDVLISIHHNGSASSTYDGLLVIYNERQDLPLATALHDSIWNKLPHNPNGYVDEGLDYGGYGMTVYGHLVSALTEAYYITNDWEAEQYLSGSSTSVCTNEDNTDYSVLIGNRINEEADALYQGLIDYFSSSSENDGGGGKPDKCSPWPECKK